MRPSTATAHTRSFFIAAACAGAVACGGDDSSPAGEHPNPPAPARFEGDGDPWLKPVPRATCRSGDRAETGIQGLGTDVRCNLDVEGQVPAEHNLSFAWYGDCAYVNGQTSTTVIDASDRKKPKVVGQLTTPGMQNNWESMKVHEGRGLLVGYQSHATILEVYEVKSDCKAPALKSSYLLGGTGHAGNFSPDGTIYYASSLGTGQVFAVDITDPAKPRVITSDFERATHDLFVGKDGARGYFAFPQVTDTFSAGSLAILDLSQIQARATNARGLLIKEISWPDGWATQYPIAIKYRGRDHLVVTDEYGSGFTCSNPEIPPYGYARILDLHDERNPTLVSRVKTEAHDPANCVAAVAQAGTSFGVSTHYCNVDRLEDPRLLACGLWAGGVRLFDIRNPWRPKEVAYFNVPGTQVPGLPRIRVKEREIWLSTLTTFYVLSMPKSVIEPILDD